MFTFKKMKNVLKFEMWNDSPGFLRCIFYIFAFFAPGAKQPFFEISEMTTYAQWPTPSLMNFRLNVVARLFPLRALLEYGGLESS